MTGHRARPTTGGGVRRWLAVPLLAAALAGCGIRPTQVPTDFGPAPSRVPCALSGTDVTAESGHRGIPVQVFLLCSSQLVTVDRAVRIPDGTAEAARRVLVAQGLIDQLAATPSPAETQAGYTSSVTSGIKVGGPRGKDPADTFRLSVPPQNLTPYALAQIVCTFANSEATAADDGSVVLAGRDETVLHRYECSTDVRTHPGDKHPPYAQIAGG
ncbi:hypothetical protein AB0C59_00075 [Streptomyces sp. NPDC048664]|uniref:hypothetical protein n=1 Tax=Streptomyces sp. NPDC048664 TaxID=3154505 RepID=UPI003424FD82